jgi:NAD(P)-dependent dehydrogenase (short-subunit alcohol dehydrogenase family)/transcriptional regulator with XRE-family HTH domain
LIGILGSG